MTITRQCRHRTEYESRRSQRIVNVIHTVTKGKQPLEGVTELSLVICRADPANPKGSLDCPPLVLSIPPVPSNLGQQQKK